MRDIKKEGENRYLKRKKSQFYIIAAIAIILVVGGIVFLQSSLQEGEESRIYDLSEGLNVETGYVYDFGIYNGSDTDSLIKGWAKTYSGAVGVGKNESWILVYGNKEGLKKINLTSIEGGSTGLGSASHNIRKIDINIEDIKVDDEGRFNISFGDFKSSFKLKEGQNFYTIIRSGGDVARNIEGNSTIERPDISGNRERGEIPGQEEDNDNQENED